METAALPLCYYPKKEIELLDLFMSSALTAGRTELHLLDALRHRLLVARCRVVAALALVARQNGQFSRHCLFFLPSSGLESAPSSGRPLVAGIQERTSHRRRSNYLITFETVPAPTVRPPSRIAKRIFSSRATGAMSLTLSETLSPGITISTPSGSSISPVTSVVRM